MTQKIRRVYCDNRFNCVLYFQSVRCVSFCYAKKLKAQLKYLLHAKYSVEKKTVCTKKGLYGLHHIILIMIIKYLIFLIVEY